jgi:hypothetical protein
LPLYATFSRSAPFNEVTRVVVYHSISLSAPPLKVVVGIEVNASPVFIRNGLYSPYLPRLAFRFGPSCQPEFDRQCAKQGSSNQQEKKARRQCQPGGRIDAKESFQHKGEPPHSGLRMLILDSLINAPHPRTKGRPARRPVIKVFHSESNFVYATQILGDAVATRNAPFYAKADGL